MVQFYLLVTVLLISLNENNVFTGEMVEFGDGTLGLALNLQYQTISVVRFANTFNSTGVMEGSLVRTSGNVAKIPVGHVYINRMVNALGSTIDGKESVEDEEVSRYIESSAPSIMDRRSVHEPFATGLTAVDAMIPIGRGQRELVIGDRQTGKTTLATWMQY